MKKITSPEHALEVLDQKIDFEKLADGYLAAGYPECDIKPMVDDAKIKKIIEGNNVLNGNWKAAWDNSNQGKYGVWQWVKRDKSKPAGFGFSSADCDLWGTGTLVGERQLVGTSAEAIYIGTDFIDLFESAWLIIRDKEK